MVSIQITKFGDEFFTTWRDVTERKQTRLEHERLGAALEQTVEGILVADAEGTVTYANPAFLASHVIALGDVVGRPAATVAGELVGASGVAGLEQAALAATPWLQDIDHTGTDGATRHLEVSMTPVRDASATVTSYVVVTRDVTELRDAQAEVALEARVRLALAETVHTIPGNASVEQAAQAICEPLVKLPFIDKAAIEVFFGSEDVQAIGLRAPAGFPIAVGDHLARVRAAIVRERAAAGPWAEYVTTSPADGWIPAAIAHGLKALAYGPIVHGDHVTGCVVIGTFEERFARTLVEKMPGVVSFSATSSALLADGDMPAAAKYRRKRA